VVSGQRSFSKLKLIKTYLRASIKQDRLNGLALLSIENAVASELDLFKCDREVCIAQSLPSKDLTVRTASECEAICSQRVAARRSECVICTTVFCTKPRDLCQFVCSDFCFDSSCI